MKNLRRVTDRNQYPSLLGRRQAFIAWSTVKRQIPTPTPRLNAKKQPKTHTKVDTGIRKLGFVMCEEGLLMCLDDP